VEYSDLEGEMLYQARREALQAERGALWDARQRNVLSSNIYEELTAEVDYRLEALDLIFGTTYEQIADLEEV
ncbi:MAG: hypothetical protein PVF77_04610, partial [Anaerolineae bacterium]